MQTLTIKQGDYVTRNGTRVTVHEVKEGSSFTVKGSIWKMYRGKYQPRTYNIWLPNGRFSATHESPLDIVSTYHNEETP